jgi:hypothetical protein
VLCDADPDPDSSYHPDADPGLIFNGCGSGFLFDADPDPPLNPDSGPDPDPSFQRFKPLKMRSNRLIFHTY